MPRTNAQVERIRSRGCPDDKDRVQNARLMASLLREEGIDCLPCFLRFSAYDKKWEKIPLTIKGESWRVTAKRSMHDVRVKWGRCNHVNIVIPESLVVIDGDWYKDGASRAAAELALGCAMPWDDAVIQTSVGGGEHFLFRTTTWSVRQLTNLGGSGLDTRVGGKGMITTGTGYTWVNGGVMRFSKKRWNEIPYLPDGCRPVLEQIDALPPHALKDLRTDDPLIERVISALHYVPPGVCRSDWFAIGVALKQHFHDDDSTGLLIFDNWSSGEYHKDGCPPNYSGEDIIRQWPTFKAEGGIGIGTLYRAARENGWGAGIDTAECFTQTAPPQTAPPQTAVGEYTKEHTKNALLFLAIEHSNDTAILVDEEWYVYTGKSWKRVCSAFIESAILRSMLLKNYKPQMGVLAGTLSVTKALIQRFGIKMDEIGSPLIVFQNGVLDIKNRSLSAHSKEHYTTNVLPYDYDPRATCPVFFRVLSEVFDNSSGLIELLQEWFGYMLSQTYQFHKIMLLLGVSRSGKSLIGRVLRALVGDGNFAGISLESLAEDDTLDLLTNKTLAFSGDTAKVLPKNTAPRITERLKKISGADYVDFKRKYKSRSGKVFPTRLTLAANNVPNLFDDSGALGDRVLIIPFNITFKGREDPYLFEKIAKEMPGISNWSLAGLARLNRVGHFTAPLESVEEIDSLKSSFSPLTLFIEEACIIELGALITTKELHMAFKAWCVAQAESGAMTRRVFQNAIIEATRGKGCKYGRWSVQGKRTRGFKGIRLATPVTDCFIAEPVCAVPE